METPTHAREDGGQRADGQDEQQHFTHSKGDVVGNQPGDEDENRQTSRQRQRGRAAWRADQWSMSASMRVVKSSTTQEQQKAAPLCFSFSTE